VILKFVSDSNCDVWRVGWTDCLAMISQILIECAFINYFYEWLANKMIVLRHTLMAKLDEGL
jgi:hypothetical protein